MTTAPRRTAVPRISCGPELDSLGPRVTVAISPAEPNAGDVVTITAELTNNTTFPLKHTVLYLTRSRSTEPNRSFAIGTLQPGAVARRSRQITLAADTEGPVTFTAHAIFDVTPNSSDSARVGATITLPYQSLRGAFTNPGISNDGDQGSTNIDGSGSSFSAQALATVGCTPGAVVTHDGASFTWPNVTPGQPDNAVASGQRILLSGSGSRLAFLGTSTWGEGKGEGKILYADGSEQPFSVAVPDWYGTHADAAIVAPYRNVSWGRNDVPVSLFFFAVDVTPDKQLKAVVLPDVSPDVRSGVPALHIFAMTLA